MVPTREKIREKREREKEFEIRAIRKRRNCLFTLALSPTHNWRFDRCCLSLYADSFPLAP